MVCLGEGGPCLGLPECLEDIGCSLKGCEVVCPGILQVCGHKEGRQRGPTSSGAWEMHLAAPQWVDPQMSVWGEHPPVSVWGERTPVSVWGERPLVLPPPRIPF